MNPDIKFVILTALGTALAMVALQQFGNAKKSGSFSQGHLATPSRSVGQTDARSFMN
ncbi:MAG: hypothetical protein WCA78_15680 [Rhizomicrobium sp.]